MPNPAKTLRPRSARRGHTPAFPTAPSVDGGGLEAIDAYLHEIGKYPPIPRADEEALIARAKAGDRDAADQVVRANLRFVVSVAKKYQKLGVPLIDLISEGNLGLLVGLQKFDETKGIKFISYAVWWVRQRMHQCLAEHGHVVRVPLGLAGQQHRVAKTAKRMAQELGRLATADEVASRLDLPRPVVEHALSIAQGDFSLDQAPVRDGESVSPLDRYVIVDAVDPLGDAETLLLSEDVLAELETLSPRESVILRLYYGLDDDAELTLEQIGQRLGITRERVRQIREKALARLRQSTRGRPRRIHEYREG